MTEPLNPSAEILLATDFCDASRSALACARQMAHLRGAAVRALHVLDLTAAESSFTIAHESAERMLREVRRELRFAGIRETATLVSGGHPARAIREAVAQFKPALLVLGLNGARSRNPSALGATVRALLAHAPCPVVTVTESFDWRREPSALENALIVTDTAPEGPAAALTAWPPAKGARDVRICAVLPPNSRRLPKRFSQTPEPFAPARPIRHDGAAAAILQEANARDAGLMVLAFRAGGYLDSWGVSCIARRIVTAAKCPVLTVRIP
ncbi:MAG TPA: universal stress protein [Acidobacteriaceae bacterium]|nr:universal stress protein [Acidobacteriaceae bacterium]